MKALEPLRLGATPCSAIGPRQRLACLPQCRVLACAVTSSDRPECWSVGRRGLLHQTLLSVTLGCGAFPPISEAIGFKKNLKRRREIDASLYTALENGLLVYDLEEGKGAEVTEGTRLQVHFDCRYRGLNVVSSRAARLLGGNRVIAEPLDFVAGEPISVERVAIDDRGGGGLFAGASGPQPPPALSTAVYGMKRGGKRSVIVPPELGYGAKGMQEIPPNTAFELLIEVLQILK